MNLRQRSIAVHRRLYWKAIVSSRFDLDGAFYGFSIRVRLDSLELGSVCSTCKERSELAIITTNIDDSFIQLTHIGS